MSPELETGIHQSRQAWLVTASCILAMAGLGVTILHFLWPTPLMFALFMTAGQGSFALAMLIYLFVIFTDLRRRRVL